MLAVRDWDQLIKQAYDHLKPGGYLELSQSVPDPGCDDGSLPDDSAYRQMTAYFIEIGERLGASVHVAKLFKQKMEQAGFEDVVEKRFKIPCSSWPKNPRLKKIGMFEAAHVDAGAEALLLRGMTQALGKSREEAQVFFAEVRKEIRNPRMHAYIWFYDVHGRKPLRRRTSEAAED
ncbi:hypothetical protein LTR40_006757 [Exophiala xenobiotica]|nr:hypothetical protein LTR40_006757 [Exophiala xenobiotica]